MSKYKAPWKEFDLNKDFWVEVLVGRKVNYYGPGIKMVKIGGNPEAFLREMKLDSGEIVWFSERTLYSYRNPNPPSPTGKIITAINWVDDTGIDNIEFDDGSHLIMSSSGWRICIDD